jgi:hypothetical protein
MLLRYIKTLHTDTKQPLTLQEITQRKTQRKFLYQQKEKDDKNDM